MSNDDRLLRETVLAELKRRRGLLAEGQDGARAEPRDDRRTARPVGDGRRYAAVAQPSLAGGRANE